MNREIKARKSELREMLLKMRIAQPKVERERAGEGIRAQLQGVEALKRPGLVACYLSLSQEMPTAGILADLRAAGHRIAVPALNRERRCYRFTMLPADVAIKRGPMHVPEPVEKEWVEINQFDCLLVPGVGFDERCGRLGFGGGHYDKMLLERRADAPTVGLAFDFQVLPEVPMLDYDIFLDYVATPTRLIRRRVDAA